jgi:2-methylisocitrate lyase-like PEP mutase family enzyme
MALWGEPSKVLSMRAVQSRAQLTAYGRCDGQKLQRDEMIRAIRYIVQAVDIPVTADIEPRCCSRASACSV